MEDSKCTLGRIHLAIKKQKYWIVTRVSEEDLLLVGVVVVGLDIDSDVVLVVISLVNKFVVDVVELFGFFRAAVELSKSDEDVDGRQEDADPSVRMREPVPGGFPEGTRGLHAVLFGPSRIRQASS